MNKIEDLSFESEIDLEREQTVNSVKIKNDEDILEKSESESSSKTSFSNETFGSSTNESNSHSEMNSFSFKDISTGDSSDYVDISSVHVYKKELANNEKACGSSSNQENVPMLKDYEKVTGQKRYREKVNEEDVEEEEEDNKTEKSRKREDLDEEIENERADEVEKTTRREEIIEFDSSSSSNERVEGTDSDTSDDDIDIDEGFSLSRLAAFGPSLFPFFLSTSIQLLSSDFGLPNHPTPDKIPEAPVIENPFLHLSILKNVHLRQHGFFEGLFLHFNFCFIIIIIIVVIISNHHYCYH